VGILVVLWEMGRRYGRLWGRKGIFIVSILDRSSYFVLGHDTTSRKRKLEGEGEGEREESDRDSNSDGELQVLGVWTGLVGEACETFRSEAGIRIWSSCSSLLTNWSAGLKGTGR